MTEATAVDHNTIQMGSEDAEAHALRRRCGHAADIKGYGVITKAISNVDAVRGGAEFLATPAF